MEKKNLFQCIFEYKIIKWKSESMLIIILFIHNAKLFIKPAFNKISLENINKINIKRWLTPSTHIPSFLIAIWNIPLPYNYVLLAIYLTSMFLFNIVIIQYNLKNFDALLWICFLNKRKRRPMKRPATTRRLMFSELRSYLTGIPSPNLEQTEKFRYYS